MCGISGVFLYKKANLREQALRMASRLTHRGPDAMQVWLSAEDGLALSHNRLSIIDLSHAADQPMVSKNKRYVMAFNGEIYNYLALKKELERQGAVFSTHSDTEVLLEAFVLWGIPKTLGKSHGMFAIALWDRVEHQLFLMRDRFGEKPLYVGWINHAFVFASELKAFHAFSDWNKAIDSRAVSDYFFYGYIPAPLSIYQDIKKIMPGTYQVITREGATRELSYWSAKEVVESGLRQRERARLNENETVLQLDALLSEVVRDQLLADVPVGAFLSGGVDSSTIVALMQKQSRTPVKTFTIGFEEKAFNEADNAKKIALHLGTDHHELYVTGAMAREAIPKIMSSYDEPFADFSQIPTYLVAQLAKTKVTVALSGDGGDEVFGGYNRYLFSQRIWAMIRYMPGSARKFFSTCLSHPVVSRIIASFLNLSGPLLPAALQYQNFSQKLEKLACLLKQATGYQSLYECLVSSMMNSYYVANFKMMPSTSFSEYSLSKGNSIDWMMFVDSLTYLPGDILAKVDRAAMANSLETRAPFLDQRIYEFAWGLPLSYKIHHGTSKYVLREVLSNYVPKSLFTGQKRGFGIPLCHWLNTALKEWRHDLLSSSQLACAEFLDKNLLINLNKKSVLNETESAFLWNFLSFQLWFNTYQTGNLKVVPAVVMSDL